jgi:hypothetical protein
MVLTALFTASLLLAEPAKTTATDVKNKAGETVDTARRYASEKKDEFEKRMGDKMKSLRDDVTELKDKAKNGAEKTADDTVKDLEAKEKTADAKLGELGKAGGKAWSSLKAGVEKAVDDLDEGVQKAKSR